MSKFLGWTDGILEFVASLRSVGSKLVGTSFEKIPETNSKSTFDLNKLLHNDRFVPVIRIVEETVNFSRYWTQWRDWVLRG